MELEPLLIAIAAGLAGALIALPFKGRVPAVVGQLALGLIVGKSGFDWLATHDPVVSTLADIGFALVMLVAGSHVPLRDPHIRASLRRGASTAVVTGVLAAGVGAAIAGLAGNGHAALYAVLLASSSAALVLPILDAAGDSGAGDDAARTARLATVAQIAVADVACVVALPLAADPNRALKAGGGGLALMASAVVVFVVMQQLASRGYLARLHEASVERQIGLDLRISLLLLLGLAALAQRLGTSLMVAGFASGLMLAAVGEPRRLAAQLFAVSDGFLAPVFFVRLGATLDLAALGSHPTLILVGLGLGVGAVAVHVVGGVLTKESATNAALTAGQLGVPIAAVAIGQSKGLLAAGEGAAILVGALVTIASTVVASAAGSLRGAGATGKV